MKSNNTKKGRRATQRPGAHTIAVRNNRHPNKWQARKRRNVFNYRPSSRAAGGGVIPHYEPHELALLLPSIETGDLEGLAADIAQNGLQNPIVLYEGKILDGVQRQAACKRANVYPNYSQFENLPEWKRKAGALAFVVSQNLHRRHLTTSQRSLIAGKLANMRQGARTDLEPSPKSGKVSQSQAAKLLKVGHSGVEAAKKVLRAAPAELVEAVKSGKTTVSKAAAALKPRKKQQVDKLAPEYVHKRFGMFLNHWSHEQRRAVRKMVHEFTVP